MESVNKKGFFMNHVSNISFFLLLFLGVFMFFHNFLAICVWLMFLPLGLVYAISEIREGRFWLNKSSMALLGLTRRKTPPLRPFCGGADTSFTISPLPRQLRRGAVKKSVRSTSFSPSAPTILTLAPKESRATAVSAAEEALHTLPTTVPMFLTWADPTAPRPLRAPGTRC